MVPELFFRMLPFSLFTACSFPFCLWPWQLTAVLWNAIGFIVDLRLFGAFFSVFRSSGKFQSTVFQPVFIYKWFSVLFVTREEMPFFGAISGVRLRLLQCHDIDARTDFPHWMQTGHTAL